MAYPWQPDTAQVAVYVPWLTISKSTPGAQDYLGDFGPDTIPDADEAQRHLDDAAATVGAILSPLDTAPASLQDLARVVVSLLAAASLAQAYARTDDERSFASSLTARATTVLAELKEAVGDAGTTVSGPVAIAYAPEPVPWGDQLLIDSTYFPRPVPYPYIID